MVVVGHGRIARLDAAPDRAVAAAARGRRPGLLAFRPAREAAGVGAGGAESRSAGRADGMETAGAAGSRDQAEPGTGGRGAGGGPSSAPQERAAAVTGDPVVSDDRRTQGRALRVVGADVFVRRHRHRRPVPLPQPASGAARQPALGRRQLPRPRHRGRPRAVAGGRPDRGAFRNRGAGGRPDVSAGFQRHAARADDGLAGRRAAPGARRQRRNPRDCDGPRHALGRPARAAGPGRLPRTGPGRALARRIAEHPPGRRTSVAARRHRDLDREHGFHQRDGRAVGPGPAAGGKTQRRRRVATERGRPVAQPARPGGRRTGGGSRRLARRRRLGGRRQAPGRESRRPAQRNGRVALERHGRRERRGLGDRVRRGFESGRGQGRPAPGQVPAQRDRGGGAGTRIAAAHGARPLGGGTARAAGFRRAHDRCEAARLARPESGEARRQRPRHPGRAGPAGERRGPAGRSERPRQCADRRIQPGRGSALGAAAAIDARDAARSKRRWPWRGANRMAGRLARPGRAGAAGAAGAGDG